MKSAVIIYRRWLSSNNTLSSLPGIYREVLHARQPLYTLLDKSDAMARDRDRLTAWGEGSIWGGDIGGDTRSFMGGSDRERLVRRVPHPAVPDLDRLHTFRRGLAYIGNSRRESGAVTDAHPQNGRRHDFDLCVLRFVTTTCLKGDTIPTLDANVNLERLIQQISPEELPYWKAAILARSQEGSARSLARRLSDRPWVGKALEGTWGWAPSHTTLSRHWDYTDEMEDALDELGIRARYGALWVGANFPQHLKDNGWGVDAVLDSKPTQDEIMIAIQHLVEEAIAVMSPHLAFGRDPDAPAYKLSPAAIIVYFAHLALEKSYAETGSKTLEWLDYPAPVPAANTVFRYIRELSVDDVDKMFAHATAALLRQEMERSPEDPGSEALTPPIHLAYDMTDFRWYGSDSQEWTNGTFAKDNSTQAWQFGVLSIVARDMSYVLGALPIKSKTEVTDYLSRFLRRTMGTYDLDIARVYMDSQLFSKRAVTALRETDAEFLIQAPNQDKGDIADLLEKAETGEPEPAKDINFSDFSFNRRPNAFAWPIPPQEIGAEGQSPHKAFVTDMDVDNRDLKGLGRQFRERWGVETSIREVKVQYHAPCRHNKQSVRAFYFMMASVLYNVAQYVDNRLEKRLRAEDVSWTSAEFLHAVRQVDPDDVPDWGDTFRPEDDDSWSTLT